MTGLQRPGAGVARGLLRLSLLFVAAFGAGTAAAETVAIRAGRLIADASMPPLGPSTIIVADGRIVAIEQGAVAAVPAGARIVDLSRYTVMPGLIDTHVHLAIGPSGTGWSSVNRTREYGAAVALHNANTLVRAGFTTVRDLGPDQYFAQAVRDAVTAGLHPGPRVQAAAKTGIIGGHGELGNMNPQVMDALARDTTCTGANECAALVRRAARNGADAIKIMATGGSLSASRGLGQQMTDAELRSIVETAHSLNMRVAAHASGEVGVEAAARAGVDSIEHGTFGRDGAAQLMRRNGVVYVPTLTAMISIRENLGRGVYTPEVEAKNREVVNVIGRMFGAARRAGVRMVFGTDSGVFAHGRNAEEAIHMAELGMTPREVLVSATSGAAELLGLAAETGALTTGRSADIIAVEGDPLEDLTALQRVRFVMARGRVVREDGRP